MLSSQTANLAGPNLITFTPRQVLLANTNMKQNKNNDVASKALAPLPLNGTIDESTALNHEQKTLLLHSVAVYLERNGFSKTLKKFMSEAVISKDSLKDASLDLEEMCTKYLNIRDHANLISDRQKEQDTSVMEEPGRQHKEKSKRKSKLVSESLLVNVKEQGDESLEGEHIKKSEPLLLDTEVEKKSKDKKNRKKKEKSEIFVDASEHSGLENKDGDSKDLNELESSRDPKKSKDKEEDRLDPHSSNVKDSEIDNTRCNGSYFKSDDLKESCKDDSKKSSKKRKKSTSEGHDSKPIYEEASEGIKRRKVEVLEECLENDESKRSCTNADNESGAESDQVSLKASQKVPGKEVVEKENGSKSSSKKERKTKLNDSSEPKTINAFQRVKVEEVVFTDRRLGDNSYWAKGGAEIGYGAKAQEVLGQVRGRDFRHEKTKKKRGSYRGGLIDLQSHSVKFSYSDEDDE